MELHGKHMYEMHVMECLLVQSYFIPTSMGSIDEIQFIANSRKNNMVINFSSSHDSPSKFHKGIIRRKNKYILQITQSIFKSHQIIYSTIFVPQIMSPPES